jgi:hypothetical protein
VVELHHRYVLEEVLPDSRVLRHQAFGDHLSIH